MFVSVGLCVLSAVFCALMSLHCNNLADTGDIYGVEYVNLCNLAAWGYLIGSLICLLPLIWITLMIKHYIKATKNQHPVSIAFKVCTLFFVNLVAGILMLCDISNNK